MYANIEKGSWPLLGVVSVRLQGCLFPHILQMLLSVLGCRVDNLLLQTQNVGLNHGSMCQQSAMSRSHGVSGFSWCSYLAQKPDKLLSFVHLHPPQDFIDLVQTAGLKRLPHIGGELLEDGSALLL